MAVISENDTLTGNVTTQELATDTVRLFLACLFMGLLVVSVIIGNILVIMCVFTYRPLRNVQNFFIVSLSCCDLAVAVLVMPFHILIAIFDKWVLGKLLCEIWLTSDILCCTASILNICVIALDRYRAIHDPINYAQKRTLRNVLVMIFLIWAVSTVISVPPLFGWNSSGYLYDNVTMVCHLTDDKSYVIYSACGSFFVPLVFMTFVYLKIFLATRARLRKRAKVAARLSTTKCSGNNGAVMETNKRTSTYSDEPSDVIPSSDSFTRKTDRSVQTDVVGNSTHQRVSVSYSRSDTEMVKLNTESPSLRQIQKKSKEQKRNNQNKKTQERTKKHKERESLRQKNKNDVCIIKNPVVAKFLEERQRISLSRERKAARTLGVIMGTFILCWLPFFLMYIIIPFCKETCLPLSSAVEGFLVWLGYVNSTLNPIIYTCFNDEFRKGMKRLVCKCFGNNRQRRR